MAQSHPSVGTTARAEPVEGTNLLFANGYDRNENYQTRPLVKVLDVADIDDQYCDDDYRYDDAYDSQEEHVTVTIKLSAGSIVTETDQRKKCPDETPVGRKTPPTENSAAELNNDIRDAAATNDVVIIDNAVSIDLSETVDECVSVEEVHKQSDTVLVDNRDQSQSRKDNLYDEYELMVERSPQDVGRPGPSDYERSRQDESSIPKTFSNVEEVIDLTQDSADSSQEDRTDNQAEVKPKVKVVKSVVLKSFSSNSVSPSSTRSTPDRSPVSNDARHTPITDRSRLFSPKTRTPIFIEMSANDTDEGQDFMSYLQELKGTSSQRKDDAVETKKEQTLNTRTPESHPDIRHFKDRTVDRRNSELSFQTPVHKRGRRASADVIVISDDEENSTDVANDSLLDFNFDSLTAQKNGIGKKETVVDTENTQSSEEESLYHDASDKILNDTDTEDADDTSDEEDEENEDSEAVGRKRNNKSDDDDDDKDGGNEKGNGNNGSWQNFDDHYDDPRDDFDNDSHHSNEQEEPNDHYESEGYFSPGMRSRGSIVVETISDFDNAETDETTEEATLEDEEVSEILEVFNRQDSIDCRFETIENRGMDVDSDSDTTASSGTANTENENIREQLNGSTYGETGFRKVTRKSNEESSRVEIDGTLETSSNDKLKVSSDDEEFTCAQEICENSESVSVLSDTSSYLEVETESDFESAIEDEFWATTFFSDGEQTSTAFESDSDITEIDTDNLRETDDILVTTSHDSEEHVSAVEYESANEIQSDEDELMETKYCNEKPEKQLLENDVDIMINDEGSGNVTTAKEAEHSCKERIRKLRSVRNVSYTVPFLREEPEQKLNPILQKKLKLVCKLRQCMLAKTLPPEKDTSEFLDNLHKKSQYIEDDIDWKRIESKFYENSKDNENEVGHIKGTGCCYYIFGVGERLCLPKGPKLKKIDVGTDPNRRSVYFRGVPGIINNANKMSGRMFPKLALPKFSASRKILHACNRLATQLSPLSPVGPGFKHGMMQEERGSPEGSEGSDSTLSQGLTDLLMSAKDLLNSSRFEDAESAFHKLYKEIQEKPEDCACLLVETLSGLADICIRRSRMCRSNPLEWQWLCMHGIALLQYTVEFCESELETPHLDNQEVDWFTEQKQVAENKCRPLEDAFSRALYNCLKHDANAFDPFRSFSIPTTPQSQSRTTRLFPLSSTMPQYLVVPGMRYRVTDQGLMKQSSDDGDVVVDWLAKFQHYCKDRLQSKDSRGVTEKILKSTSSKAEDDTESIISNSSRDSLDWDNSDLQGIDEITMDGEEESPVSDYSFEYELVSGDSENEGWDFFLHQRRNCNFESVVQVASDYEKCDDRESRKLAKETQDVYQHEKGEKNEKAKKKHSEPRDMVSPLHAHSISLTLARSFCRLADKLVKEEDYRKAEAVYEKILDIVDTIQDGTAGMLRFSARIMKNLGTVKSKQGKSSSGLVLLNKALNTYRDLQDEEANFEIAVSLIELGNGYIVGKNHEDSVFDDVIIAICDFFEKDASDSHSVSTSSSGSGSQLSAMTSSLGSNSEERNVEEAVTCYSEAIALLDHYEADEKQIDMFAKAVMRLGDCYFMQKDYDKALECYEKALGMFKTNNIFGKDSLMENAHVLCMLGVSSFMLHVYPRAASVFEMALHMVRCAYGFKRTFLNGMLQSLSGITYYKMKNYHKCVSMCYQGYETYCEIFGESMCRLDKQKFWLVCQTLYVMGNSYNILNLQHKAMKYLTIARSLMKSSKCRERRQFMRVLQILGDAYFAQYEYKTALTFYNEALEYGECESQVSFDEVFDPNCASDEMTIHNHLVSKSAEAHLSMQQYQNAVHYLEQAHDMQEVMGEDIKEDLINTLNQLGHMHSVAGDVDKAIESYKECLEVFSEIHKGKLGPEMCTTLGNLAAICYVKACISESLDEEHDMTKAAHSYFQDAINLDMNAEVCVKYGNFLYSQCYFTSAITYLTDALNVDHIMSDDIVYGGLEKVTLPELLQDEVDTQEEICLPSSCLARYLLILCHKAEADWDSAEIQLICLMEEVTDYDIPLLHALLGYAMMEVALFEEAAHCFLAAAAESEEEYQLAHENFCICLLVLVLRALRSGVENFLDVYWNKGWKRLVDDQDIHREALVPQRVST